MKQYLVNSDQLLIKLVDNIISSCIHVKILLRAYFGSQKKYMVF